MSVKIAMANRTPRQFDSLQLYAFAYQHWRTLHICHIWWGAMSKFRCVHLSSRWQPVVTAVGYGYGYNLGGEPHELSRNYVRSWKPFLHFFRNTFFSFQELLQCQLPESVDRRHIFESYGRSWRRRRRCILNMHSKHQLRSCLASVGR